MAHRLAWLYVYGAHADLSIDHINGVKTDNRIGNLRQATKSQNRAYAVSSVKNKCGLPGVRLQKRSGKWLAECRFQGKNVYFGCSHLTKEAAHAAYLAGKAKLHGEFGKPIAAATPIPKPIALGHRPKPVPFSVGRVRELLSYDPIGGIFYWRNTDRRTRTHAGKAAGFSANGYLSVSINYKTHRLHRLAWLLTYGEIPKGMVVDHINGVGTDNRIANLRLATVQQNRANGPSWSRNRTGLKGAYPQSNGTYDAVITANQVRIRLGNFPTELEAHNVYVVAADYYFGEFANAGHAAAKGKTTTKATRLLRN
jgi:HNH endonuclease/AP2 domain